MAITGSVEALQGLDKIEANNAFWGGVSPPMYPSSSAHSCLRRLYCRAVALYRRGRSDL